MPKTCKKKKTETVARIVLYHFVEKAHAATVRADQQTNKINDVTDIYIVTCQSHSWDKRDWISLFLTI